MDVEIVYFDDCPNLAVAREHLMQAFAKSGRMPQWREWNRDDPESPAYARGYGSPTILVDGKDVTGVPPSEDGTAACRVYLSESGIAEGAPAIDDIVTALAAADGDVPNQIAGSANIKWRNFTAALPAIGAAALPKLTCPACWPAYSGLLSAAGISFINYTPYLLPLMVLFVGVSLLALGWGAQRRRGYGPLFAGLVAAAGMILGKFMFDSDVAMYAGVAILMAASLWNAWPRTVSSGELCPDCVPVSGMILKRGGQ